MFLRPLCSTLLIGLAACTGAVGPPEPAGGARDGAVVTAPVASPVGATEPLDAMRALAAGLHARLDTFVSKAAPAAEEGDLSQVSTGYFAGSELVFMVLVQDVGEYVHYEERVALQGGRPVYRSRRGHAHAPTDAAPSRFRFYEAEVALGPDGSVLSARGREAFHNEGIPADPPDLGAAAWGRLAEPLEQHQLDAALAAFSAG